MARAREGLPRPACKRARLAALSAAVMNSCKRLRSAVEMSANSTAIPSSRTDRLTRPMQDTVSLPRWSVRRMRLPIGSGSRSSSVAPPTLSSRRAATPPGKDAYCPLVVGTCGSVRWLDCSMESLSLTAPETCRGKRGKSSMRRVSRPKQLAGRRRGGYRRSGSLVGFLHRRHFRTPPSRVSLH